MSNDHRDQNGTGHDGDTRAEHGRVVDSAH